MVSSCPGQGWLEDAALRDEIELVAAVIVVASESPDRMSPAEIDDALGVQVTPRLTPEDAGHPRRPHARVPGSAV